MPAPRPPLVRLLSRRDALGLAGVCLAAAGASWLGHRWRSSHAPTPLLQVHSSPRALPPIALQPMGHAPVYLEQWRGQWVLLNLWATWCAPCREEMPALDRLQARLQASAHGSALQVLALSLDAQGVTVAHDFLQRMGLRHLRAYGDVGQAMLSAWQGAPLPSTLLINPQGDEVARYVGAAAWDGSALRSQLAQLTGLPLSTI